MTILHYTLDYIEFTLANLFKENKGRGGFLLAWSAYQLEIAYEEVVYGHPLSVMDRPYSAALGTCSVKERSLTHVRGFLGLSSFNSATVAENPPPLDTWTKNMELKARVRRLFPLTTTLDSTPSVIGAAMLRVILGDLFNDAIPYRALQFDKLPPGLGLLTVA